MQEREVTTLVGWWTKRRSEVAVGPSVVMYGRGERTRRIGREDVRTVRRRRRDHSERQFKVMTERTAVDYPTREERFDVVYQRRSVAKNTRVRVICRVNERDVVQTVSDRFPFANWAEREVWDLFGVGFEGHPDRRRIMTDYGFEGHPRRKDFPLSGYTEVRYDEEAKRVVQEPRERSQAFRAYRFESPWKQVPSGHVRPVVVGKTG